MMNKTVFGGTAYLTIVKIYQRGPVNYLMGGFRCLHREDTEISLCVRLVARIAFCKLAKKNVTCHV